MMLKSELKKGFFMGGHKDRLIQCCGKFLESWQVELVHEWKGKGKIIVSGEHTFKSTATGKTYTNKIYKYVD